MFYPGTDAAVQIPVAAAVARHVVRLAQRLDTPQVTGENLRRSGRHKDAQNYCRLFPSLEPRNQTWSFISGRFVSVSHTCHLTAMY